MEWASPDYVRGGSRIAVFHKGTLDLNGSMMAGQAQDGNTREHCAPRLILCEVFFEGYVVRFYVGLLRQH